MKFLEEFKQRRLIEQSKSLRYGFPRFMYKHRELRKYIDELLILNKVENQLYFDTKNKSDIEHQFARLMLLRVHDFSAAITVLIGSDNFHGIFPVMRALTESVMLLKYVDRWVTHFFREVQPMRIKRLIPQLRHLHMVFIYWIPI